MTELPSGTVSLLFSDVEGSTVLLSRLGPAYTEALDEHRALLRSAWDHHDGVEVSTEGDSFFVAFPTAAGAVGAAAQAQQHLHRHRWPAGEQVRVRIGVHTGSPQVHAESYVGMDVHRAARIAATGHGGQVVISSATAELASGAMPDGVGVQDLGRHRLKDLPAPEHLFQLIVDGLPSHFPPLRSLGAASTLPRPPNRLVGRDSELADLTARFSSGSVRLLTLTGSGGAGKTRLSVALAERLLPDFPDGVYFVPLAAVTTAEGMWSAIGEALDISPQDRAPPRVFDHLRHRSALILLDNLEQLSGADSVVADLLEHAPHLLLVATSRRPLALGAEHTYRVPPLGVADPGDGGGECAPGAVQLFEQRARMVRADFSLTAENTADVLAICRRLDGLPLAIELAAARVRLLSPAALLARLSSGLELADSGVDRPTRQKTLHAAIAWSYDLLEPLEQAFFRQLGVFAGGADLDAVSAVTADRRDRSDPIDLLATLADANLVKLAEDDVGEPRVQLLETIRAFALRELDASSTADDVRRSHARHYAALAETLRAQVIGPTDQVLRVRRRHQLELDNLRAGMAWAVSPGPNGKVPEDRARLGLALAAPQAQLWLHAAHYTEAREWLERVIAAADQRPSRDLARCLNGLAVYLAFEGHLDRALDAARATVAMCRELGEERGLLVGMTTLAQRQSAVGDIDGARTTYDEARGIAEQVSDHWALALATVNLASLESDQGNYESALELNEIAQHLFNDVGDDLGALWAEYGIVQTLRRGRHVEEAERRLREQVPALLRLAEPHMLINASEELAMILSERRGYRWSARLLGAATATRQRQASRRDPVAEAELERQLSNARAALTPDTWSREHRIGEGMDLGTALAEAASETSAPVTPAP